MCILFAYVICLRSIHYFYYLLPKHFSLLHLNGNLNLLHPIVQRTFTSSFNYSMFERHFICYIILALPCSIFACWNLMKKCICAFHHIIQTASFLFYFFHQNKILYERPQFHLWLPTCPLKSWIEIIRSLVCLVVHSHERFPKKKFLSSIDLPICAACAHANITTSQKHYTSEITQSVTLLTSTTLLYCSLVTSTLTPPYLSSSCDIH